MSNSTPNLLVALGLFAALGAGASAGAAESGGAAADSRLGSTSPAPLDLTAQQDHQKMMELLHITSLRRGADPNNTNAPNAVNYDESKANPYPNLPDPLVLRNGQKVTSVEQWWQQRRPEIVEDFDREVYGRVPADAPQVKWEVAGTTRETNGEVPVVTKQLVGHVDNSAYPPISVDIDLVLTTPANAVAPVPVMMEFGFNFGRGFGRFGGTNFFFGTNRFGGGFGGTNRFATTNRFGPGGFAGFGGGGPTWQQQVLAKGWGYAIITPTSIQADNGAGLTKGIIGLCNRGQLRKADDWGALRAWAWGASRALDYLETDSAVDAKQVGIEGLSRYGKAALVAMAYDRRFAIGFIGSSGEGGAKLHRRNFGELVENLTGSGEYHWMAGNFLKYGGPLTWNDLPVDAHELITLCAPRPTFISYGASEGPGAEGKWVDQRGSFMAAVAAGPVFRLLSAKDLGTTEFPPLETGLMDGELSFRQHRGGHTTGPNWPVFLRWADRYITNSGGSFVGQAAVIVSSKAGDRLAVRPAVRFAAGPGPGTNTFHIDDKTTFQTIAGFGASFLEAGIVCLNTLPGDAQEKVLENLFDPVRGAGFSAMKTPLAGTDFMSAGPWYTYNDTPGDVEMKHFSIDRDLGTNGLVTFIKRARKHGSFVLQAPMDYPPDWMLFDVKTNQDVDPKYFDALALYYLRYLQEYETNGVHIDYLSLFNEPGVYTKIPYTKIRELLVRHVAPRLASLGLRARLMLSEAPTREQAGKNYPVVLDDPEARRCVAVMPYHGYDHVHLEAITGLHARYPELPLWMTELCHAYEAGTPKTMKLPRTDFEDGDFWGQQIFADLEAGASAWIYWNLILDQTGGPWLVSPVHGNPDENIQHPVVIVDRRTHQVTYTGCYYYLAHFGRYVPPGSVRVAVTGTAKDVRCLAFKSPAGRVIAELMNSRDESNEVHLVSDAGELRLTLPPVSITTCVWQR